MTTHRLTISAVGAHTSAMRDLSKLERQASAADDHDEDDNIGWAITTCVSGFYDALLALVKGDADVATIKEFFFKNDDPAALKYHGGVIHFSKDEANEA